VMVFFSLILVSCSSFPKKARMSRLIVCRLSRFGPVSRFKSVSFLRSTPPRRTSLHKGRSSSREPSCKPFQNLKVPI
jgi:hypothetical protein